MLKLKTNHFLTGTEISREELAQLIAYAEELRVQRREGQSPQVLAGRHIALLFEKPSLRTRVSFTVATQELGGQVVELMSTVRKKEEPEDTIQVLAGYCHAVMMRTHEHSNLERMVKKTSIPIINGLSDAHHPCQALADIQTLQQRYGYLKGLKLAYVGDGNNVLHSLMLLAPYLGIEVHYACPTGYEPNAFILRQAKSRAKEGGGQVVGTTDPIKAVTGANAIYTDVWTSMGFEEEENDREKVFGDYQVNEELCGHADARAAIMHCMPMVRGKEITETVADSENAVLFQQSENRLHAQKALLVGMMSK